MSFNVEVASKRISRAVIRTQLQRHDRLSEKYQCNLFLKREDQQIVRSYKIRGAFNKISSLKKADKANGVVCASAGNHAQGVAYSCRLLGIKVQIFMPENTPQQKIDRVQEIGKENIAICLFGNDFDACAAEAIEYSKQNHCVYIPPFDDKQVIEGQATVALEILEDLPNADYIFIPIGGGGLAAGVCSFVKSNSPKTILIGVEPKGAASMSAAIVAGKPIALHKIDPFIDGAAVKKIGEMTFPICKEGLNRISTIPEGKVCTTLLTLYNEDGIVAEPAGALSISALDEFTAEIKGKNVVCILSGGNNDSNRMQEIKKLADEWEGLQHYMIVRFQHNPDGLKEFFTTMLGEHDYVNRIEYVRRDHGRSTYALLGVRCRNKNEFERLRGRMLRKGFEHQEVDKKDFLFKYWV